LVDGIDVHRVGGRESYWWLARRHYRRHLRDRHVDVVVEDLNKAPLYTPTWVGAPVVLLVHHLFGGAAFRSATPPVAAATWALERTVGLAYRGIETITVSESTAEDLVALGMRPECIAVVHNGVDDRLISALPLPIRDPVPTALYLGRLERYKRVDLIIRAIGRLRDGGGEGQLIIAGDGRAMASLQRLVRQLRLGDRVRFTGRVTDAEKRSLMDRAWAHVITSMKEGWGITVMEAAACGTPTIASDAPGLRDAVVHGESGLLVRHGDVVALADTLRSLFADRVLLERLGVAARQRAERFTWDAAAEAIERHLAAVVGRERPPLAGMWSRFRRSPPLATVGLARTGTGDAPYGAASWIVEAIGSAGAATARVSIGATDWSGRRVLATVRVLDWRPAAVPRSTSGTPDDLDPRESRVTELPGWPLDHATFLRDVLVSIVGSPFTLTGVRRVAEPLVSSPSSVPERDERVDRRRAARRPEAGDHADRRQR
jgi:glycosyltransferase involved in cell wall biosynthesis